MSPSAERGRTVPADETVRRGRLGKAKQFLRVADDALELEEGRGAGDAAVSLYVLAGIAAADAICARALGQHSKGQDHQDAIALLASVDREASKWLSTLLGMKTRAGYGHDPVGAERLRSAQRAASSLVERAQ